MAIDPKDYSKVVTNGLIPPMFSVFRQDSPFYDPAILPSPLSLSVIAKVTGRLV